MTKGNGGWVPSYQLKKKLHFRGKNPRSTWYLLLDEREPKNDHISVTELDKDSQLNFATGGQITLLLSQTHE